MDKPTIRGIRQIMADQTEYIIKNDLLPMMIINLKDTPEGIELSYIAPPNFTDDRLKEYLVHILKNWNNFKRLK